MASSITSYGSVSSSSGELYYEREGNTSGPAVLFIHGLGGTTNTYQPVVGALQEYNLVRFDLAGHGRSALPKSTSIDSYVEDAEAVVKHLNLEKIAVVGHSLGGLVAATLAAKLPSLVTKLVLFGPVKAPPDQNRPGPRDRASKVRAGGMTAVADTIIGNAFAPSTLKSRPEIVSFGRELLSRQNPEGYALACLSLAESKDPNWSKIKAEVTIVSGSEDTVSTPALCRTIADLMGHVKVNLITLKDVGHWHTLEKAQEAAKVIKDAVCL